MRRFLTLTTLAALVLACSPDDKPKSAVDPATFSWPSYRGDSSLSGLATGKLPENPQLLWSFQTGDDIKSSPVIGFGRLYVGSTDGKLYALDVANGDSLWAFEAGDDIEAPPMLLDSTVFVGSLSGEFFAIHALTGLKKWSFKTDDEIYGSATWVTVPNKTDKWVLVGSYDFNIYCFDTATGEKKWAYETDNFINGAPATDGQVVVFGGCDEHLHIISITDGKQLGAVAAGSYIAGSAALYDGHAYLGHYGEKVIAVDLAAQKIAWTYDNNGDSEAFFSSPAVDKNHVVIGGRDKLVHCLERRTGRQLWTFPTHGDVDSSPVICEDRVVVGSNDGRLYMLSLKDGSLIWSYEIGADIIGSPAVTGGRIFVGAEDGRVYAFGESL